eukprot:gene9048-16171_t
MPSAKCATADALPTDALPRSLPAFEAWMRDAGISWDEKLINFGEGAGWGVWAVTDIDEGSLLCTIPKDAIISTRTTSISDILKKEKLGGGLGLTTAVMFEAAIGKKSKWYGYFQSLPKREYLPVFWSAEELDRLKGTELDGQALEDRDAVKEDFETEVEPLADRYGSIIPKENWTLENFSIAASWVASRAYHVDSYHEDALVPLASYHMPLNPPPPITCPLTPLCTPRWHHVASRAFHVDSFHGDALVPLASYHLPPNPLPPNPHVHSQVASRAFHVDSFHEDALVPLASYHLPHNPLLLKPMSPKLLPRTPLPPITCPLTPLCTPRWHHVASRAFHMDSFHEDALVPLASYHLPPNPLPPNPHVHSQVASRAFHVDSFHGDALVPLADVFNHKASIVELNDAYAVAKDDMLGGSGDELDEEEDEDEDEDGDEVEGEDEEGEEHSHGEDDESGGGESDSDVEAPVLVALDGGEGKKRELSETEGGCQKHKKQKPGCSDPHCHKTSCGQHEMVDAHGHCATHDHNESELEAGTGQAQDKPVAAEGGGKEMAEGEKMANVVPSGNKNYVRYGVNLRLEIGICDLDKDGVEVLDIVAASSLVKGAEVHNTYGEHGNAELVKKYGFALRRNPFNELSVSKEDILKTSEEAVGKKALSKRFMFRDLLQPDAVPVLEQPGGIVILILILPPKKSLSLFSTLGSCWSPMLNHSLELLEPDAEPFLVQPGGLINRSLLITLQVLLSSEEDFKKWNDMDDVPAVSFEGEHDDGAVGVGEGGVFEDTFAIPSLSALSQSPSASNTVPGASESGWNTAMGLTLQAALLQRLAEYRSKDAVEGCDDVAAKLAKF